MNNEKIKEVLLNIIELISKSNEINVDFLQDLNKRLGDDVKEIYSHLIDINNFFSNYKEREDLDRDAQTKRIEKLEKEVNMLKQKSEKMENEFQFNVSQDYLKLKDINDLTEGIRHLIDEL